MKCNSCSMELNNPKELAEHLVTAHAKETKDFLEKILSTRSARYVFKI